MKNRYLLTLLILLTLPLSVHAAAWEKLLMPGEVISGHAKYEIECEKCHEAFDKASQRRLCLDCHEKVAADIKQLQGLHGRDDGIREVECKQCHSDHLGRDADIIPFNHDLFDHKQTDFPLKEAHQRLACGACHKPDKLYREAPGQCIDCHKSDDVHKEKMGKKCHDCHSQQSWRKAKFDHDKTDYKLTGKHKEVSCGLCHPANRFKDTPEKCYDCHQLNDVHNGGYGKKCLDCHSTKKWDSYSFDHDKTDFSLSGKHKESRCISCHKDDFKKELKTSCISCHKQQDRHKGQLGEKCQDCHNSSQWEKPTFKHKKFEQTACYDCHQYDDEHKGRYGKECDDCHSVKQWSDVKYDHKKETDYALNGQHKELSCSHCHRGEAKQERDKTACFDCHQQDDPHQEKLGKQCENCHNETDWREKVTFDHELSQFPLIGLHTTTPCDACHLDSLYAETPLACLECHQDEHKGRLGKQCGECHNPNSWQFWQFDHDKTDFKLKEAHQRLECKACHRKKVVDKIELASDCNSCHRGDDPHNGHFGVNCERCHNQRDFQQISIKP